MAGLPYNCRCFTVTGNVAGIPNPSATGNNGGSGGSGGGGAICYDCNGNVIPCGGGANPGNVDLTTLLTPQPNRTFIYPNANPQTWAAPAKCYVKISATAAGGGGGGRGAFYGGAVYVPSCVITDRGCAVGGAGGGGGAGAYDIGRVFSLNAGDQIVFNVGSGGGLGASGAYDPSSTQATAAGGNGAPTIYTVKNQTIFLVGGQGGGAGSNPSMTFYSNTCGYGVLISDLRSGSGGVGGGGDGAGSGGSDGSVFYNWPCAYSGSSVPSGVNYLGGFGGSNPFGKCTQNNQYPYDPKNPCSMTPISAIYTSGTGVGGSGRSYIAYSQPNGGTVNPRGGDGLVVLDVVYC